MSLSESKRLSLYVICFMSYILFVDILCYFNCFLLDFFLSCKWLNPFSKTIHDRQFRKTNVSE